ncbi:MAG: hypothetical protein ABJ039_08005, partial [Marinomonas sp.]
ISGAFVLAIIVLVVSYYQNYLDLLTFTLFNLPSYAASVALLLGAFFFVLLVYAWRFFSQNSELSRVDRFILISSMALSVLVIFLAFLFVLVKSADVLDDQRRSPAVVEIFSEHRGGDVGVLVQSLETKWNSSLVGPLRSVDAIYRDTFDSEAGFLRRISESKADVIVIDSGAFSNQLNSSGTFGNRLSSSSLYVFLSPISPAVSRENTNFFVAAPSEMALARLILDRVDRSGSSWQFIAEVGAPKRSFLSRVLIDAHGSSFERLPSSVVSTDRESVISSVKGRTVSGGLVLIDWESEHGGDCLEPLGSNSKPILIVNPHDCHQEFAPRSLDFTQGSNLLTGRLSGERATPTLNLLPPIIDAYLGRSDSLSPIHGLARLERQMSLDMLRLDQDGQLVFQLTRGNSK